MASKRNPPNHRPASQYVGGLIIPKYIFSEEKCLSGLSYEATPEDIFIVTYPKSGTTWSQYIVWEILNSGIPPPNMNEMLSTAVPFLEFTGAEPLKEMTLPRPIKTHLPFHLQPYHPLAKYIYIARNPQDNCVSFYNHHKEMPSMYKFQEGTLDDFFECFMTGDISYGHWFDHVLSWYAHKDDPNVLFLTYEQMKSNQAENILTIAKFMGTEYHEKLTKDPNLLSTILHYTSFEYMKQLDFYLPKEETTDAQGRFIVPKNKEEGEKFDKVNFFWKGKVGNWKSYLTEEQAEELNYMMLSRPRGAEIASLWKM